jgi:ubiquitin-like 1-activating enzyme E1 B
MNTIIMTLAFIYTDLDTIDVSNLNRQFLFRPEHVGKSKAEVAALVMRTFNPELNLIPHFGNVKDPKFGFDFIQGFDIVLNALDNVCILCKY